jgi:hypothetical protein
MASTYSTDLRLELIGSGEQSGVWGSTTNLNLGSLIEQAVAGVETIAITSSDQALIAFYGAVDEARNAVLVLSSSGAANVYVPPVNKVYVVRNAGSFAITMYNSTVLGNTTAAGTGLTVAAGTTVNMFTDGVNFYATALPTGATTGTGSVVYSVSPALTGTPTAPTANAGTNTTQIATTAFVQNVAGGLGTMSTQNASAVSITGGSITGITDLAVADGGTGSSNLTANAVLIGNGTSAITSVSPGTSGNVLTSNGTTWTSATLSVIGVGQTWQNVLGSRSLNTSYTNSTGKPIMVSVFYTSSSTNNNLTAVVGGVTVAGMVFSLAAGSLATGDSFSFIVPAGTSYQINTSAAPIINNWAELR